MPGIPCSTDDGNEAVFVISNLSPANELPTQSLCPICAAQYFVALLADLTTVDVSEFINFTLANEAEDHDAPDTAGASDDEHDAPAEPTADTTDEVFAASDES